MHPVIPTNEAVPQLTEAQISLFRHSRAGGNPAAVYSLNWMPAFAGMTGVIP
jgi:hypothetical protein